MFVVLSHCSLNLHLPTNDIDHLFILSIYFILHPNIVTDEVSVQMIFK